VDQVKEDLLTVPKAAVVCQGQLELSCKASRIFVEGLLFLKREWLEVLKE
jgi:hypothetical protein